MLPCSSLFLHPSDTDMLHLHPRVPMHTPLTVVSRHQTSAQTWTDTRHERKQKGSGQLPFSVPTVLCRLIPVGTQCPAQANRTCWGVLGKLPTSCGFLHQGQKEAFQKWGAVLNAVMDLQACLGFGAAISHPHFKESFRPAAISGPVMR